MRHTLTVPELARLLGVCRASAYAAIREGEIESIRMGHRILVPTAILERTLGLNPGALAHQVVESAEDEGSDS